MSTAWDLYDSYNALEVSSLPVTQSIIDSSSKASVKRSIVDSSSRASVPPKDQDRKGLGSTTEKSKISVF